MYQNAQDLFEAAQDGATSIAGVKFDTQTFSKAVDVVDAKIGDIASKDLSDVGESLNEVLDEFYKSELELMMGDVESATKRDTIVISSLGIAGAAKKAGTKAALDGGDSGGLNGGKFDTASESKFDNKFENAGENKFDTTGDGKADDANKAIIKDTQSETTKDRVLSNIAESKNARESSNFGEYVAKENALLDTTGKDSAKNVASYEKLKVDLKAREKTSANQVYSNMFNQDGTIKKEFLPKSDTQPIITGEALGNKALKEALIKDGSDIKDWGKYSLEGKNQELHYYYNRKTGEVFYDMDYKSKFKHIKGNK